MASLALRTGSIEQAVAGGPPAPILIRVQATRGRIIPQSKGGGGFERSFRFAAAPAEANRWIMQVLTVRGTLFDERGVTSPAHLDVVEYYRVDASGRAIQSDSHYSQFWEQRGGDLTISSTLTYGVLLPKRWGDAILLKSFMLASAKDAAGAFVEMKTRTTRQVIPAERGERVEFDADAGSIPTRYTYRVSWDARIGTGSRTKPSGKIEVGTWQQETPPQTGPTQAVVRMRPIPRLEREQ